MNYDDWKADVRNIEGGAPEGDWQECFACGGTGKDFESWDGECLYCDGSGERFVTYPDEDYDE